MTKPRKQAVRVRPRARFFVLPLDYPARIWYNAGMRIDKFLKVSRILKRRTVASDACSGGKVTVNGRSVKPAYQVKVGDVVTVGFAGGEVSFRVKSLNEKVSAKEAETLYELV